MEAGRWPALGYMGNANCEDLWQYIYNAARLPGVPLDRMAQFPGHDHVAVMHRGHIFKVMPEAEDGNLSVESLTRIFESILERECASDSWTSILVADDRTSWAEVSDVTDDSGRHLTLLQNREALIEYDSINKETIEMVETSAFLICLDETSPSDPEGRVYDLMMLDCFNRWVDKTIAFVICKNSVSGTYVEHTMIDVSIEPHVSTVMLI